MAALPQITAFRSHRDILELRDLYYDDPSDRVRLRKAVSLTSFWLARETIPHGIISTSLFISTKLRDEQYQDKCTKASISDSDMEMVIRSAYSMAFIRFVNGLLDPFQQGTYAAALVEIAKKINLPYAFVELRHLATHNKLPSLEYLREMTDWALEWLWESFWVKLEPGASVAESLESTPMSITAEVPTRRVYDLLKEYRRLIKVGQFCNENSIIQELMSIAENLASSHKLVKLLVRHWEKFGSYKPAFQLYNPLLLCFSSAFKYQIILTLISYEAEKASDNQFDGLYEWADFLIRNVKDGDFPFKYFIEFKSEEDFYLSLKTHSCILNPQSRLIRVLEPNGPKVFAKPALLDDILLEPTPPTSDVKDKAFLGETKRKFEYSVFQTHEVWNQTPFGVVPN